MRSMASDGMVLRSVPVLPRAAAVDIDERHGVLALTVHEHQRLVWPEAA